MSQIQNRTAEAARELAAVAGLRLDEERAAAAWNLVAGLLQGVNAIAGIELGMKAPATVTRVDRKPA